MRLIRDLSERIEDEIKGVKIYAKMAIEVKEEHPVLADMLYSISRQESEHVSKLHDGVASLITEFRRDKGEPPKEMLAVYEYLHEKHIDDFNDAKRYQDIYSSGR